jgi:hypothetical protein
MNSYVFLGKMPDEKLVKDGKALYRTEAIKQYGKEVVDRVDPVKEIGRVRIYLIKDLKKMRKETRKFIIPICDDREHFRKIFRW